MEEQVYKLTLNLNLAATPPNSNQPCLLCEEIIESVTYDLVVLNPVGKTFYFDESCFNQVLAIGIKLYAELQSRTGKEVKN